MNFDFDAGKHAIYLWPAFAVSAAAFAWLIADSVLASRRWRREAERLQAELDETRP
ncbi:heme exporter protein CcmD [Caulobacter vibrioides]|uniref:Heme exporter protein D n=1 Tax=Caulobacter vibrioides TaxID=155892 RepID=A0A290MUZ1_CAUVI|nr:heme exporter protein CcmD [Caulobacter vibrioides]ATC33692.1 heme exporter protein CcmD [Caulobacter vibrioides]